MAYNIRNFIKVKNSSSENPLVFPTRKYSPKKLPSFPKHITIHDWISQFSIPIVFPFHCFNWLIHPARWNCTMHYYLHFVNQAVINSRRYTIMYLSLLTLLPHSFMTLISISFKGEINCKVEIALIGSGWLSDVVSSLSICYFLLVHINSQSSSFSSINKCS